jgi:hypothetical protein
MILLDRFKPVVDQEACETVGTVSQAHQNFPAESVARFAEHQ